MATSSHRQHSNVYRLHEMLYAHRGERRSCDCKKGNSLLIQTHRETYNANTTMGVSVQLL